MNIPPVDIKSSSRGESSLLDGLSKGPSDDDSSGRQFAEVLQASTSDAGELQQRISARTLSRPVNPASDDRDVPNQVGNGNLAAPLKRQLDGALRATRSSSSIVVNTNGIKPRPEVSLSDEHIEVASDDKAKENGNQNPSLIDVKSNGVKRDETQPEISSGNEDLEVASDDKDKENGKQKSKAGTDDASDLASVEVVQALLALTNLPVVKVSAKPNQSQASDTNVAAVGDALAGTSLAKGTGKQAASPIYSALPIGKLGNAAVLSNSDGAPSPQNAVAGAAAEVLNESFPDITKGVDETNEGATDPLNYPIIPPKLSTPNSETTLQLGPASARNLVATSTGVSIVSQANLPVNSQAKISASKDVFSNIVKSKTGGNLEAANQSLASQKLSSGVPLAPSVSENIALGGDPKLQSADALIAAKVQISKVPDLQQQGGEALPAEVFSDNSGEDIGVKTTASDSGAAPTFPTKLKARGVTESSIFGKPSPRDAVNPALGKSVGGDLGKPDQNSLVGELGNLAVRDANIPSESGIELSGEANLSERILAKNEFDQTQPASTLVIPSASNAVKSPERRTLVERALRSNVAGAQLGTTEALPTPTKSVSRASGNEVQAAGLIDPNSKSEADLAVWKTWEARHTVQSRSKNLNAIPRKENGGNDGGKSGTTDKQAVQWPGLASEASSLSGVGIDGNGTASEFQTLTQLSSPSESNDQNLPELPESGKTQPSASEEAMTHRPNDKGDNSGLQTRQIRHANLTALTNKLQNVQEGGVSELAAMGDANGNQQSPGKTVEGDSPLARLDNVHAARVNRGPDRGGIIDAQQTAQMAPGKDDDSSVESSRKNMPNSGKNDSPARVSDPVMAPSEALRPRREVVPDKFGGVSIISNVGLDKAEVNHFGGDAVAGAHGEDHLHTRLAERIWSAVESFRTSGASDWIVRIRPDQDSELNLRLRLQSNQLIVQAHLGNGNWDAVTTRWPELQAQLAERGVQLRPLDGDQRNDSFAQNFNQMNPDNPSDRRQSGDFGKNQEAPELDLRFLGELPERRKGTAKTAATSSANGWEGWA